MGCMGMAGNSVFFAGWKTPRGAMGLKLEVGHLLSKPCLARRILPEPVAFDAYAVAVS